MTGTDHEHETSTPSPAEMPAKASSSLGDERDISSLPEWARYYVKELRNESGRYRRALRDVEAERDTYRDDLAGIRRTQALDAVADVLDDPDDLGRHHDLATLVDDTGAPDPDAYRQAAEQLVTDRPRLAPPPAPPTSSGTDPDRSGRPTPAPAPDADPGALMSDLMRGS